MKTWSFLQKDDIIPYVIIDSNNIHLLLEQKLKIQKALIKNKDTDGLEFILELDPLGDMRLTSNEFYTEQGVIAETSDSVLLIAASTEYMIILIQKFIDGIDINKI